MQKLNSASLQFSKRRIAISKDHDAHWAPNIDIYCTETGLVIKVELAGMQRENLELTVEGNRLHISGQRPDGCRPPKCKFLVMEINYGAFGRVIEVPEGCDLSEGKACYQNGFLRIDVPYSSAPSRPRTIMVSDDQA
jgi:HSP20 family protein